MVYRTFQVGYESTQRPSMYKALQAIENFTQGIKNDMLLASGSPRQRYDILLSSDDIRKLAEQHGASKHVITQLLNSLRHHFPTKFRIGQLAGIRRHGAGFVTMNGLKIPNFGAMCMKVLASILDTYDVQPGSTPPDWKPRDI